jgi:hypothetical protein
MRLFVTDGDAPRSCVRWGWSVEVEPNGSGVGSKIRTSGVNAEPVGRVGVNTDCVGEVMADSSPLAFPSRCRPIRANARRRIFSL